MRRNPGHSLGRHQAARHSPAKKAGERRRGPADPARPRPAGPRAPANGARAAADAGPRDGALRRARASSYRLNPAVNFVPELPPGDEDPLGRNALRFTGADAGSRRRLELVALPDGGAFDLLGMSG